MHLQGIEPKALSPERLIITTFAHWTTGPLYHWALVTHTKLVLYMSPVAYLGKVVTPKAYRTFYICPGPVFRYEFNGDICLVIRLT